MTTHDAPAETPKIHDLEPTLGDFRADVLEGLSLPRKALPCKYLYDERGSKLFDKICEVDEYYPTRTEIAITRDNIHDIAAALGPRCVVIEPGSGSSMKTGTLLDNLEDPVAYIPVEISREHLADASMRMAEAHPNVEVLPVCADFTRPFDLPTPSREYARRVVYFPGSTLGNFRADVAKAFLAQMAELVGEGGALLIGLDLQKDSDILEAAYNDKAGVTAAFNTNLLRRMNRELDADFDLDAFEHRAFYNEDDGRIESHIVSLCDQTVRVAGHAFSFAKGETIYTECSHKYTLQGFARIADAAGFRVQRVWTDEDRLFSVQYAVCVRP